MTSGRLAEHFFRHEYGKLVATLSRRAGISNIGAVEDAVQFALLKALETWPPGAPPDNPTAWLFRVAQNALVSDFRARSRRRRLLEQAADDPAMIPEMSDPADPNESMLHMLFFCCDPAIPVDSQLVFVLKILCGLSVEEIAQRLFVSEANVYKRLGRARAGLQTLSDRFENLSSVDYAERLSDVHTALYALFTEGHLSSQADMPIRADLCKEAIRLTAFLASHRVGQTPETYALLALMHLHAARIAGREDGLGGLLLLEEQERAQWDQQAIAIGLEWLSRSAQGDRFSRYHAEAGIAAEHCLAPSFEETRWDRVAECYAQLEAVAPSAMHRLNRAVAVAEWQGPEAGLALLQGFAPPTWLSGSYLWAAVLADLHRRCRNTAPARHYREQALELAPTPAIRALLERRLLTV
ncbi:RNA polymerase sigma factor [Pelagibacterium halotolerans]|uniref:RNA polymerase sigma factor n=1 Tax=Pelagibacterium halotolerans TaxID=531813 RepID=UPI00384E5D8C